MKKFLVVTEKGWSPGDEDIIQMHKLCHDLNMCGAEAYITHKRGNPLLKTPFLNELENTIDCEDFTKNKKLSENFFKDYYVIYPENISPELFNYESENNIHALQYFDKHAKLLNVDNYFLYKRKKSYIFSLTNYYQYFSFYGRNQYCNLPFFTTQYIDFNTFKNFNLKRKGDAYIQKKGAMKIIKHSKDALFLDPYLHDWSLVSQILNTVETLYCYDVRSVWPVIGALCGCQVIIVPNILNNRENILPEKYRDMCELYKYGIAFNDTDSELQYAKNTLQNVVSSALQFCNSTSQDNIRKFVLSCEVHFHKHKK